MAQVKQMLRRFRADDGGNLIEFALVLPLLLLVMLGIIEFGFIFQRHEIVTNAAREGARMAVLPGYTEDDVKARVADYLTSGGVPTTATNPVVTSVADTVSAGASTMPSRRVTVTYTYTFTFLPDIGSMFGASYGTATLTAVSNMRTEIVAGS